MQSGTRTWNLYNFLHQKRWKFMWIVFSIMFQWSIQQCIQAKLKFSNMCSGLCNVLQTRQIVRFRLWKSLWKWEILKWWNCLYAKVLIMCLVMFTTILKWKLHKRLNKAINMLLWLQEKTWSIPLSYKTAR